MSLLQSRPVPSNGRFGGRRGKPSLIPMTDTCNGVLHGVLTFSAMVASTLINVFGPRVTTLIGITDYPICTGKLIPLNKNLSP